jgi:hypothetical protein
MGKNFCDYFLTPFFQLIWFEQFFSPPPRSQTFFGKNRAPLKNVTGGLQRLRYATDLSRVRVESMASLESRLRDSSQPILLLNRLSGLFSTYSTTIFLMNLSWTSCSWVVAELTRVIYGRNQQVDPNRVIWGCWLDSRSGRVIFRIRLESSRRKLRLESESMTWLVTTLLEYNLSFTLVSGYYVYRCASHCRKKFLELVGGGGNSTHISHNRSFD